MATYNLEILCLNDVWWLGSEDITIWHKKPIYSGIDNDKYMEGVDVMVGNKAEKY